VSFGLDETLELGEPRARRLGGRETRSAWTMRQPVVRPPRQLTLVP